MQVRFCDEETCFFNLMLYLQHKMIRDNRTQKIDELVEAVLKQMGLYQKFKEHEVCNIWPEVVGQMIASRTKSVSISDGKLFVAFTSAVVKNEIMMVKEGLIKALNDKLGERIVKDIIIK